MDLIPFFDRRVGFFALLAIIIVCVITAIIFPLLGDNPRSKRAREVVRRRSDHRNTERQNEAETARRRKEITESIRQASERPGKRKVTLRQRLAQGGLSLSPGAFIGLCGAVAIAIFVAIYFVTQDLFSAIVVVAIAVIIVPTQVISYLARRRISKFVIDFPMALEAIVRGVRSGLPLNECFVLIADEAEEPLKGEFRFMVDAQSVGLSLGQAAERVVERIPSPEVIFFSIVINIQQSTGGNIGEAFSNLSQILRDRKKMRDKIKAISAEAVTSAFIIGAMPFLVGLGVYFSNGDYMMILFETTLGHVILGVSLIWMVIGAIVMRSMINFEI